MNYRTTIILAMLAVVAAVAVVFVTRSGEPKKVETAPQRLYKDLKVDDITRIEIQRQGKLGTLALEKVGDKWRLTRPVEGPADRYQVLDLARQLADITLDRKPVPLDARTAKDFGLEPPVALVRFTAAGSVHELAVGNEVGVGRDKFAYVRRPGAGEALPVKGQLHALVNDEVADFRDKALIDTLGCDVVRLAITRGRDTIVAEKPAAEWTLTRPVHARADDDEVRQVVSAATGLSALAFVTDEPADLARYGLDAPRMVVELQLKSRSVQPAEKPAADAHAHDHDHAEHESDKPADAQKKDDAPAPPAGPKEGSPEQPSELRSVTITVGGYEDLQKNKAFARVSGSPSVVTISEGKIREMDKDLFALRDKAAVPVSASTAEHLALDIDGVAVTVEKKDGRWQILAPEKAPADNEEVAAILSRLADLKVRKFVDGADPRDAAYGFDKPFGTVAFRQRGDTKLATVTIGKNRQSGEFWTIESGTTAAGRVDGADAVALKRTWLDLRKRNLWRLAPEEKITAVSWTRDAETVSIVREQGDAGTAWKMTSPVAEELDPAKVARLADALAVVSSRKYLAPADKAADYSLDKPALTLAVTVEAAPEGAEKKQTLHRLSIAKPKDAWVAVLDGGDLIFEIDKDIVDLLEKPMSKGPWIDLDKDRVNQLDVAGPDWTLSFGRSGDDWRADNAPDFAVNSLRVRWYLGDLADAEVAGVIRYAAADLAEYGLDKPAWRIRARGLTLDKVLLLSDKGPGADRYATLQGSGRVVLLDTQQVSRLVKDKSYFSGGQ